MDTTSSPPPLPVTAPAVIPNVRTWCAICHASALLGVFLHMPGHLLPPLIIWMLKRDQSPEIDAHGKEAVNFQISMLIYNLVAGVFCLVLIGFFFLAVLWVLNAIVVIVAAIQASEDFCEYSLKDHSVPALMLYVGAVAPEKIAESKKPGAPSLPSLHSSKFLPVADGTIRTAVAGMTSCALDLMKK